MVASQEGEALKVETWHLIMRNILISQGLHGVKEKALLKHFHDVHEDNVKGYLELLLKEDKAQKFKYKNDFYWRATNNILEDG